MNPLMVAAADGIEARMESLDMLANNLANADTPGYKTDREFYDLFVSPYAAGGAADGPETLPVIERNWTDYSQGAMRVTSNPLDFAIDGKGFFAVKGPAGALYTRDGSFRLSADGTLVTEEGYAVLGPGGKALRLDAALPVDVGPDGSIRQAGQAAGRLELVEFDDPHTLLKQGSNYFSPADPKARIHQATGKIRQGRLEDSNVNSAESAVRLVSVMRQFDLLQRAIAIGKGMDKKAVEQVASVGS